MSRKMIFTQSMWAMERRDPEEPERSLSENLDMIAGAGFDGISGLFTDPTGATKVAKAAQERALAVNAEWQCFPRTVDELKPVIEFAAKWGGHHICLQADIRPPFSLPCCGNPLFFSCWV